MLRQCLAFLTHLDARERAKIVPKDIVDAGEKRSSVKCWEALDEEGDNGVDGDDRHIHIGAGAAQEAFCVCIFWAI